MNEHDNAIVDGNAESVDQTKRIDQLLMIVSELQITNDELRAKLQRQATVAAGLVRSSAGEG